VPPAWTIDTGDPTGATLAGVETLLDMMPSESKQSSVELAYLIQAESRFRAS
jgi:hypothetical protein